MNIKRGVRSTAAFTLFFVMSIAGMAAANAGVSQGFSTTETNLVSGTLMGINPDDHTAVPAVSARSYQLLGLVAKQPLLALSDGTKQVQVTVSGPGQAIVSNLNGTVKAGDKITASPIKGVGMKAVDAGQIVGTAQTDLSKSKTTDQTITDKTGKKQTIQIGSVDIQISVGYYAGSTDQSKLASVLPPSVLAFANSVTGQQVSPLRVIIGLLALVFGFVIVGIMLQSAIRSGIIAIGRNPLAKSALRHELLDVLATALAILGLTVVTIYIILKI